MFTQILTMVLPVLVMIVLGRVCAVTGILNDEQHTGIKNIIGNILLPVVLFQAFFTADYGARMLLVFVLVFAGYGIALAAGYALRKLVQPYDRFMPLLLTSSEGGMLGYALFGLLCGADQTKTYAMVDIGQTMFAYTVFLTALKAAGGDILESLLGFITAPTSALILIVIGYQRHVSKALLRPVLTTMGLRLGVLAVICAAICLILFSVIPYDKQLLLALMLQYSLPAAFIIPLFADLGKDAEYVSTTLSLGTVLAVILYFFLAMFSLAG